MKIVLDDNKFIECAIASNSKLIVSGDKHLLKAIDIMYSGEIVFLLNAETIKNPHTNIRKELVKRLSDLNADIEYIQDAFTSAERTTGVEVAMVHISIERSYEEDFFKDSTDKVKPKTIDIEEKNEIASSNAIEALVEEYSATINEGLAVIKNYFQHSRIHSFFKLSIDDSMENEDFNNKIYQAINAFIPKVRHDYWNRVLDLEDVKNRMTGKKRDEFYNSVQTQADMEFTVSNIRAFMVRLIGSYEDILTAAVADIFDKMTVKHNWFDETSKNTHYFNGWKTNKAFYCNKKVILPMSGDYSSYGSSFRIRKII